MSRTRGIALALFVVVMPLSGCREGAGTTRTRRSERAAPRASVEDASARPEALSGLGDVEPITTTMERDETIGACLTRERARLSTGASEALTDLGYDTFLEDVCTSSHALAARDASACGAISVERLREVCVFRVAVAKEAPLDCPREGVSRDPLCLAFASGDQRLCDAAPPNLEARCRAVLRNDRRACRDPRELHREECEALVLRLSPLVASRKTETERIPPVWEGEAVVVDADGARGTSMPIPAPDLVHGVVLRSERCTTRLVVGDALEPSVLRLGRVAPTNLVAGFHAGSEAPFSFEIDRETRFRVHLAPHEPVTSGFGTRGTVEVLALEARRGGRVEVRLNAEVPIDANRLEVSMHLVSWIRDIDPIDPSCANSASPEGRTKSNTRRRASPRPRSRSTLAPP